MTSCEHYTEDAVHYECMKHQAKMCASCARCKDPGLYCKFRPSCMIHFMDREKSRALKNSSG